MGDDDWHLAIVDALLEKEQVRIVFIEYGKPQVVQASDVRMMDNVVDDDGEDLEEGHCEMCGRYLLLTFHHLIPKDTHRKYIGKKLPKGVEGEPTRWFLNTHGTMICRSCHSTVHHFASNDVLGAEYNTLEKLLAEPYIQRWIEFAKNRKPALKRDVASWGGLARERIPFLCNRSNWFARVVAMIHSPIMELALW